MGKKSNSLVSELVVFVVFPPILPHNVLPHYFPYLALFHCFPPPPGGKYVSFGVYKYIFTHCPRRFKGTKFIMGSGQSCSYKLLNVL